MACDDAATQQEETFLQALADTRSFQLDDDSLELHDAEGETLATLAALE
jgi:heat shock protein HslJ